MLADVVAFESNSDPQRRLDLSEADYMVSGKVRPFWLKFEDVTAGSSEAFPAYGLTWNKKKSLKPRPPVPPERFELIIWLVHFPLVDLRETL